MRTSAAPTPATPTPINYVTSTKLRDGEQFGAGKSARENAAGAENFFNRVSREGKDFSGADGAYSVSVGDRTIFGFGDTLIGGRIGKFLMPATRYHFLRHSLGVVEDGEFKVTGQPFKTRMLENKRDWISPPDGKWPLVGSKHWYWPGAMHEAKDGVKVMLNRFHLPGMDMMWGWKHLRTDVATLDPETLALKSIDTVVKDPTTMWGSATLTTDEHTYMYGGSKDETGKLGMKVARTADHGATTGWEYLAADGSWSSDVTKAAPQDVPIGAQFSVSKNAKGGVDLLGQVGFNPEISVVHGDTPAGPWHTDETRTFEVPKVKGPKYSYNAVVHEGLSDAERLVVSVNQNSTSVPQLVTEPTLYRPHFFTIPRPGTEAFTAESETKVDWGK